MRQELEWILKESTIELLESLNLEAKSSFSGGMVNPRKQTGTTWVGVDTHKENTLHDIDLTSKGYAEAFFTYLGEDINEYIWMGVSLLEDDMGQPYYNIDENGVVLARYSKGFIFLSMEQASDLFNDSKDITDSVMDKVRSRVSKLFLTEVSCYAAWVIKDTHNLKVFNRDNQDFSVTTRNVININNRIDDAVNNLISQLQGEVAKQDGLMQLELSVDYTVIDEKALPLKEFLAKLNEVSGIKLTIGDFKIDKPNKKMRISFLSQNLPRFSEIRQNYTDDLLKKMLSAIDLMVKNGEFDEVETWEMAGYLIKDEPFSAWPILLQTALFKVVVDSNWTRLISLK